MTLDDIVAELQELANPEALAGMARFGIATDRAYGVPMPRLRLLAKRIGRSHELAQRLWDDGWRETVILATLVDDPRQVTAEQMDDWSRRFRDWETCDQCCMNLFGRTPLAYEKALAWSEAEPEFVKRAGFVVMARVAVSDKKAADDTFVPFLDAIERQSDDSRNYVKKAVNWALRQIGKRSPALWVQAVARAEHMAASETRSARWIAADALRELRGEAVMARLGIVRG